MLPRIYCLVSANDDLDLLGDLALAGVSGFQVRDKHATTREMVALARWVIAAVRPMGAMVIVDDRLDVALASGADGVHLGGDDLSVLDARRITSDLVVGATCRDVGALERAAVDGATYAGFGPVFASVSKAGLPAPLGLGAVEAASGVLPLIAIGGIDAARARQCRAAGAHGVAVINAIWRPPDPLSAAKELVRAVG